MITCSQGGLKIIALTPISSNSKKIENVIGFVNVKNSENYTMLMTDTL